MALDYFLFKKEKRNQKETEKSSFGKFKEGWKKKRAATTVLIILIISTDGKITGALRQKTAAAAAHRALVPSLSITDR